ncbi:unnamed protein product, partial [Didymodactylos carnosus]
IMSQQQPSVNAVTDPPLYPPAVVQPSASSSAPSTSGTTATHPSLGRGRGHSTVQNMPPPEPNLATKTVPQDSIVYSVGESQKQDLAGQNLDLNLNPVPVDKSEERKKWKDRIADGAIGVTNKQVQSGMARLFAMKRIYELMNSEREAAEQSPSTELYQLCVQCEKDNKTTKVKSRGVNANQGLCLKHYELQTKSCPSRPIAGQNVKTQDIEKRKEPFIIMDDLSRRCQFMMMLGRQRLFLLRDSNSKQRRDLLSEKNFEKIDQHIVNNAGTLLIIGYDGETMINAFFPAGKQAFDCCQEYHTAKFEMNIDQTLSLLDATDEAIRQQQLIIIQKNMSTEEAMKTFKK